MAVAFVQEFEGDPSDRSTDNYDFVRSQLGIDAETPAGLIVHTAGFADGVFRIFDVWESAEQAERFHTERVMPIVEQRIAGGNAQPPNRQYTHELHDLIPG
jgi:hypothetical protein